MSDVQENDTNVAEAPFVDCSFDFRLRSLFSADSAHAVNRSPCVERAALNLPIFLAPRACSLVFHDTREPENL